MKISKEVITGFITVAAIGLLVAGVNFLKGNSFFGGDEVYYAYFSNSGQLASSSPVTLNGVTIGRVLTVENVPGGDTNRAVKISFNIQDEDIKIPVGTTVEIGSLDLFSKGIMLQFSSDLSKGYYKTGDELPGIVASDMMAQVKSYADPISQKLQAMMSSVDKVVNSVSAFWDTTATSELEGSLKEVKIAIKKFGNAADQIEGLVVDERQKLSRILSNVETITVNLKKSNDNVKAIVGNVKQITDDLVTSDFKGVITNAKNTLSSINSILEQAKSGEGTLGKLLGDETLYNELVKSNHELQNLVNDIQLHPERYIHFSVLGAKTKGVPLTSKEEKKLRNLLDSIPN
ncbi:MAG: MlaD family protein [Crocinitomicaceae bacterium]